MMAAISRAHVNASHRVARAIDEAGWSPVCDGLAAVSWFTTKRRSKDAQPYLFVETLAGDRQVQVAISPTGRSVRVYVDGTEVDQ